MSDFDPIRASREELTALGDVLNAMRRREGAAELAMSQAETELNAIRKIRAYCQQAIAEVQQRIASMEAPPEKPPEGQPTGPW